MATLQSIATEVHPGDVKDGSTHHQSTMPVIDHQNTHSAQDFLPTEPNSPQTSHPIFQINFSWRHFELLVGEKSESTTKLKPLYIVDCKAFKIKPRIIFKRVSDDSIIGTGTLHPVSIHADVTLYEYSIQLQALKRLHTSYCHLSQEFSDTDTPVQMVWTSEANFKVWDFICLDQNQQPVAKFSTNIWAMTKIGTIEFLGEKTRNSERAREEIVVMGTTLYSVMALRMNNFLNLFGSAVAKTGKIDKGTTRDEGEGLQGVH